MKVTWKKRSRWERVTEPVASRLRGRQLTVNGRAVKGEEIAKPAVRAVGGLVIATAISAVLSTLRRQGGD